MLQKELEGDERTNFQLKFENRKRSVGIYALLAVFLGGFGVHRFYIGKIGSGILYLLLCWTGLPVIIGFFDALFSGRTINSYNRKISQEIYQEILFLRDNQ